MEASLACVRVPMERENVARRFGDFKDNARNGDDFDAALPDEVRAVFEGR
ncbi:hypothetical protein [Burkholderia contaminans]|nr:hypothetical protein [Burkholderia contaminans]